MTRHSVGQRRRRRCFYYSRDRKGEHPQRHLASYAGLFQADAFDGYRQLYLPDRSPGPIVEAGCWVHARRPFFAMADLEENARRQGEARRLSRSLRPILTCSSGPLTPSDLAAVHAAC